MALNDDKNMTQGLFKRKDKEEKQAVNKPEIKRLTININENTLKKLKLYAVNSGQTMGHIIEDLIEKNVPN